MVVAYHFPPIASSGTFRTLKFTKYLHDFGWDPVVLTVDDRHEHLEPKDPALSLQVPEGTLVIRTRALRVLPSRHSSRVPEPVPKPEAGKPGAEEPARASWLHRVLFNPLVRLLTFPDRLVGWYPFALARGLRAVRRHEIDVIYTSGPPFSGSLVGLTLSLLTRKPLVSDFRDPWIGNTYAGTAGEPPAGWLDRGLMRVARSLERRVFDRSASVINVSEILSDAARKRARTGAGDKFHVISNGFDPDDFSGLEPRKPDRLLRVVYAGCFYPPMREPRNFLNALASIRRRGSAEFPELRASFFGEPSWAVENAAFLEGLQLGSHVEFQPFRPHREVLQIMAEADVLLMLGSNDRADTGTAPAKMFEYLALRRPILALVHEGESARIARDSGLGVVANPEDPDDIASALLRVLAKARKGPQGDAAGAAFLARHERRELTRQLAVLLDMAVCAPTERSVAQTDRSVSRSKRP